MANQFTREELERIAGAVLRNRASKLHEEMFAQMMGGAGPYAGGTGRTRSAGAAGRSYIVEIITDPTDPRGFDAKPCRRAA
jgi:hypothetical protein